MASFDDLPAEMQRQIITLTVDAWPSMVGVCASVSVSWQLHVERRTFASLRLDQSRVQASREIMTPVRQTYVRQLQMEVLLPEYDAKTMWNHFETSKDQKANNQVFTEAMMSFFSALAGWNRPTLGGNDQGISLELHAFSPSDREDVTGFGRRRLRKVRWENSFLTLKDGVYHDLPALEMINSFKVPCILARERRLRARACCELASRMPNLVTTDWDLTDNEKERPPLRVKMRDELAAALAQLPGSLRHFRLKYGFINPKNHAFQPPRTHEDPHASDPLSTSLRRLSERLSTLQLDGSIVFDSNLFWPSTGVAETHNYPHWPYLKELRIYAAMVTPSGTWLFDNEPGQRRGTPPPAPSIAYANPNYGDDPVYEFRTTPVPALVNEYCLAAARAAARMPRLACLELRWEAPRTCMLAYDVRGGGSSASLFFASTPAFDMSEEVKEAWRSAARVHAGSTTRLVIEIEDLGESA